MAYGKAGCYAVGREVLPFLIASQMLDLRLPERLWVRASTRCPFYQLADNT